MKKNRYLVLIIVFFIFSFFAVQPGNAQWVLPANIWNLGDDLEAMILILTNFLLGFIAMVSVVALIWGGLNYISSSGDTQKADTSKRIIYYAFIGMFVAGVAFAIVKIVTTVILV